MPKPITTIQATLSPEHFIALWLAIHGGDPAPDKTRVLVAGSVVLEQLEQTKAAEASQLRAQVVGVMQKALAA